MHQIITVTGMTCANCARHVRTALQTVPGVSEVYVDLDAGRADLTVERPVESEPLARALEEEGYALG